MGRTSAPRRRVAVLSTSTRRWSRRSREVLLGKQDLPTTATAPSPTLQISQNPKLASRELHDAILLLQLPVQRHLMCAT